MTTPQREAVRLLRIVKKEFKKLHTKAWNGNAITVGQSNDVGNIIRYTFDHIERLIKSKLP